MKTQFDMKYMVLFIALLWAFVGRSQGTIESCKAMGLYFCTECEDTGLQCDLCASGYTLTSNSTDCLKCTDPNCIKCSINIADATKTDCETCKAGYYLKDGDKICVSCDITNCNMCHMGNDGVAICDQCDSNYYKVNDSECAACSTNCSICSDGTSCDTCVTGYMVTSSCDECPTNCASCTLEQAAGDKCTKCVTGYAVDPSTDKCVSCSDVIDNCEECNVDTGTAACTGCKTGFEFTGTVCISCSVVADCVKCDVSSDAITCTVCKTGFSVYNNTCYDCSSVYSNCLTCSSENGQIFTCDSCYPGYSRTNEECIACPDNCLECENFNSSWICSDDKCATGYQKLSSDNLCHACPNNCAKCTESNTTPGLLVCDTCLSQFTLNTTCEACPANCAKCSTSTVCDTCKDGYYLDSDNVCQTCPTNCAKCSASTVCETCKDSYYLDSDNVCQSTRTVGTGCVGASFKSPSCSVCQEGVGAKLVSDKCLINCYTCGNLTNNEPTSIVTECNSQGNEYQDTVPCEYGCYIAIKYSDSQMIFASRGCVVNATCLSDDVELCSNTGPSQNCFKCCNSGELCNGDYWDPSSAAVSHVIGIITTSVTILAAYVIN